jgi:integrase
MQSKRLRRGRGEGTIYQRPDGLWCGAVTVGYDVRGKRRRRAVYASTKHEVQQKLSNCKPGCSMGQLLNPTVQG